MAEVRAQSGVPLAASFAGLGAPTLCAPIVVDTDTGIAYTLKSGDVVTPAAAGGTVTSVALSMPAVFVVGGSPVTASGTLAVTLATETANLVWAGPTTGAAATPTFRALVNADLPATAVTPASYTYASITVNQQGLITAASSGTAPVTAVSVASANGFAGSSSGGTTPALTLTTTVNGLVKGNGTALSVATAGTDYVIPGGNVLSATEPQAGSAHGAVTLDASAHFQSVAPGTAGNYLRSNGTDFASSAIQAGDVPTLNQSTSGNAGTATALATPRAINGVNFDGTAPITVTAAAGSLSGATLAAGVTASSLTSVGTLTALTVSTDAKLATSSGNVLVGTSTAGAANGGVQFLPQGNGTANTPFTVSAGNSSSSGDLTHAVYSTSASQYQFYVTYDGTVHARVGAISVLSDETVKENVRPLDAGLAEVLRLAPVRYDMKDGSKRDVPGFIAQQVQRIAPELIDDFRHSDTEMKLGMRTGDMIPMLVRAIQQLHAEVQTLRRAA